MANITVYLPHDVEAKARKAARSAKLSLSKWVSLQLDTALSQPRREWSPRFLSTLGSCPDFPDLGAIRLRQGEDSARERFPE